jgi:hypothetical protein
VLPEAAHRAAQATADMVIKAARSAPGSRLSGTAVTHVPLAAAASGYWPWRGGRRGLLLVAELAGAG